MMMNQGTSPAIIKTIEPKFKSAANPTSTRVELRYGPYNMPSSNDTNVMVMPGMEDESGVVDVMFMGNATKPCSDCTLKYASANLHYPDGTVANLNTGAWLHHMTLSVSGPGRSDFACGSKWKDGERMLVVHNDRNETYYGANGQDKYGYYLSKEDKMSMVLELKNDATIPKNVYFTVTFEYIPGKPAGYKPVKALWMDAQKCGAPSSEIEPPKNTKIFTLESDAWVSTVDGELLTTVGHMHDGATHLELFTNGQKVCESVAKYGGNKEYETTPEAAKLGVPVMEHITRYGPCSNFGKIKKGDKISLKAHYDFVKNKPGLGNSGAPTGVMGIALTFIGVDSA
jgi:hypothetical protein